MIIYGKMLRGWAQRSRGLTVTEAAIVLGVAGLVLGAIWLAASEVNNKSKIDTAYEQVWQIANNYRAMYTGQAPTGTLSMDNLVKSKIFPSDMLKPNLPFNVFGGAVTVRNINTDFVITLTIPETIAEKSVSICTDFLTRFTVNANGQDGMPSGFLVNATTNISQKKTNNSPTQVGAALGTSPCNNVSLVFGL